MCNTMAVNNDEKRFLNRPQPYYFRKSWSSPTEALKATSVLWSSVKLGNLTSSTSTKPRNEKKFKWFFYLKRAEEQKSWTITNHRKEKV